MSWSKDSKEKSWLKMFENRPRCLTSLLWRTRRCSWTVRIRTIFLWRSSSCSIGCIRMSSSTITWFRGRRRDRTRIRTRRMSSNWQTRWRRSRRRRKTTHLRLSRSTLRTRDQRSRWGLMRKESRSNIRMSW